MSGSALTRPPSTRLPESSDHAAMSAAVPTCERHSRGPNIPPVTRLALWIALGLLVAGVLLGALPVHNFEGNDCGDAFSSTPEPDDPSRDSQAPACTHLREQA